MPALLSCKDEVWASTGWAGPQVREAGFPALYWRRLLQRRMLEGGELLSWVMGRAAAVA